MSNNSFKTIRGKFDCQKCNEQVDNLRLWYDTLDLTWQCSKKHISRVNIAKKKKKYERTI